VPELQPARGQEPRRVSPGLARQARAGYLLKLAFAPRRKPMRKERSLIPIFCVTCVLELRFLSGYRIRHATGCHAYTRGKNSARGRKIMVVGALASYKSKIWIVFILTNFWLTFWAGSFQRSAIASTR
jgi:hypothetical protein